MKLYNFVFIISFKFRHRTLANGCYHQVMAIFLLNKLK